MMYRDPMGQARVLLAADVSVLRAVSLIAIGFLRPLRRRARAGRTGPRAGPLRAGLDPMSAAAPA
jgi:hypothetical protein